jgi:hypothetical protein
MLRRLILHPFLLVLFPILYLFSENLADDPPLDALVRPALLGLIGSAAMLALLWLVFRSVQKAALLTSILVLLFYSFGHVLLAFPGAGETTLVIVWGVIAVAAAAVVARLPRTLPRLTSGMNVAAVALVVMNLVPIVSFELSQNEEPLPRQANAPDRAIAGNPSKSARAPDIYYIILDRYADDESLRDIFGYDNRPFLEWLSHKGFYVAEDSTGNYPRTSHSLGSSLNMRYLDSLAGDNPRRESLRSIHRHLEGFKAARVLQANGYRYYHLGSWFFATADDPTADVNYSFEALSEFESILYRTTLLRAFSEKLSVLENFDSRRTEWARRQFQFDTLVDIADDPGPKFVFAHILVTHPPYPTDSDGDFVTSKEEREKTFERRYLDSLEYANDQTKRLVERLLSVSPENPPVVVLQADEGPHPHELLHLPKRAFYDWTTAPPEVLLFKYRIFNSYFLPDGGESDLYPSITPVNTFRVIFNRYLGTHLKLLPDRNYALNEGLPYDFVEITRKVRKADARADVR